MNARNRYQVIIIGGGIAGASFAYFLSERGVTDVLLLEKEEAPGYHATGRSAAVLCRIQLVPVVLDLLVVAADFLFNPPEGFSQYPLIRQNGILIALVGETWSAFQQLVPMFEEREVPLELLTPQQAAQRVPVLNPEALDGAAHLPEDGHLDVNELLANYLRVAKSRGVEVRPRCEVTGITTEGGRCSGVVTPAGELRAQWVVNAAGAWAGQIAGLASASPVSLTPMRRCAVTFAAPDGVDVSNWPMVGSEDHKLYFEPDAGGLLMSPMDEHPMEPCDAQPDDLAIAEGMERLKTLAPAIVPRALKSKWAGLRTFAPDRAPVVGPDPLRPGFFWLAGQGGTGIETSPALGRLAADLLVDGKTGLIDAGQVDPGRFAE
jgi:D-arginine dehydrogenase